MQLKPGSLAPAFEARDIYGQAVDLHNLRGQKVYLSFFRNTACPFCNLRIIKISRSLPEMRAQGLVPIFLFESQERVIKRSSFCDLLEGVHLIGDPDHKIYQQYGMEKSLVKTLSTFVGRKNKGDLAEIKAKGLNEGSQKGATRTLIPGDFLIDEGGRIHTAHYGEDLNDRLDVEVIESFLKEPSVLKTAS